MSRMSEDGQSSNDVAKFSESYDGSALPVGLDMAGHDTYLMGPKVVMLDSFIVDLLTVDTSAQTFRLKLLVNMDWEDDGTIEPELKAKRNLGRATISIPVPQREVPRSDGSRAREIQRSGGSSKSSKRRNSFSRLSRYTTIKEEDRPKKAIYPRTISNPESGVYKTGKYVPKQQFADDPLATTWNPEVVLVNAIADENPIEAGSKFHCIQMLSGRPVISRSVLYQPECRCEFTFANFPFDETDLVVKFSSTKWHSEQVNFIWSERVSESSPQQRNNLSLMRQSMLLKRSVDESAIGGVGLSEFEIIKVRVETDEKDVNSMQRYDNAEGAFSQAHLIIRVRRDPYSYLLRVASVAELLMFLEVLSFLTDNGDLSARFSISGTIFLAMVSLYGPMADALPKVSVVTRVDKWHLYNFVLLFASNVENLLAFMLRSIINETLIHFTESLLGILYLFLVVRNLMWFIEPLKDREKKPLMVVWFDDKVDLCKEQFQWVVGKVLWWRKSEEDDDELILRATAASARATILFKKGLKKRSSIGLHKAGVSFDSSLEKED